MLNNQLLLDDPPSVIKQICLFIKKCVQDSNLKGAIVSVSGGIDSAVALALTVKAIGPENVTCITMPECDITPEEDLIDVTHLTELFDVTCERLEISMMLHVMRESLPIPTNKSKIIYGNIKARLRMLLTYFYANMEDKIVVGTSNKSELLTGFFTKYGDGGVDIMPLADLYKTQIRQLAYPLKIPERIITKPPSPGFWPGQTDEDELGISYEDLDRILYSWENNHPPKEICDSLKIPISKIKEIIQRVKSNEHKRHFPLILRLS
jgi:NAD+ synthase